LLEIARKLRIAAIAATALGISPKIASRGRCPVTTVVRPATSPVSVPSKIRVAIVVVNLDTSVETVLRWKEIAQVRTRIGSLADTVRATKCLTLDDILSDLLLQELQRYTPE
jgi:hypothetical protein